ncbi:MAG: hypothetical protein JNK96_11035 [Betaproteobacteria bacterium]|nr:hypothetical protein [Betaproteobacteria bacterium]
MSSFDTIDIHRPDLARSYLALLAAQPGRPLALFAPRRVGKTWFLDHDLAPIARTEGLLPVYADLWLNKAAPLEAINHALEEALDDLAVPPGTIGRLARTQVKKIGALGASIDLGDEPRRRGLPDDPALRFDALVVRLGLEHGGRVLLLLDEAQALADQARGGDLLATLRAVLHKRQDQVEAVLTGSSQEGLARILSAVGTPMYQFAQLLTFPVLGDEFLVRLTDRFAEVHQGRAPRLEDLRRLFTRIGCKPALMRDIVKTMSAEGETDPDAGLASFMADARQVAGWQALLNTLDAFERGVLTAVAQGLPPLGRETRSRLAAVPGANPTVARVRTALENLKRAGILTRTGNGLVLEDELLAAYLIGGGG